MPHHSMVLKDALNVTGDQLALQLVSEIEGLMSIYYDCRFEDFSHLQMLLAFPYLIFKSRSAIRKVGLYTREYVVVWSFIYIYTPYGRPGFKY
jgi:hypothetical protein